MYLTSDAQVRNLLIVDDSAFEQRMLADLLSEMPYRVSVAFNGEQGYQLALSGQPDLILLDVRMPNMDGYTCCRLLKANPATRDIPIIFLSGTEAVGRIGPDLTHIGSRLSLGAGTLTNTFGTLGGWVGNPQVLKPGNHMPATLLPPDDFHALITYLRTLE